ncbi:MAG: N-6 DNA methylase [Roseovarius sp.]
MTGDRSDFDLIGRVYEYFISELAGAEGKRGGEFYTPKSVVDTMIEMIEPTKGRVYDLCCGTGGFFVQSEKFIDAHQALADLCNTARSYTHHWRIWMAKMLSGELRVSFGTQPEQVVSQPPPKRGSIHEQ